MSARHARQYSRIRELATSFGTERYSPRHLRMSLEEGMRGITMAFASRIGRPS